MIVANSDLAPILHIGPVWFITTSFCVQKMLIPSNLPKFLFILLQLHSYDSYSYTINIPNVKIVILNRTEDERVISAFALFFELHSQLPQQTLTRSEIFSLSKHAIQQIYLYSINSEDLRSDLFRQTSLKENFSKGAVNYRQQQHFTSSMEGKSFSISGDHDNVDMKILIRKHSEISHQSVVNTINLIVYLDSLCEHKLKNIIIRENWPSR